mmetsp:Transcript_19102/g.31063  ORF Transcript_19102/g.31063 Transcript_19102/m.31063 type:complete len:84 (-) Transcript_19102:520-771(-)
MKLPSMLGHPLRRLIASLHHHATTDQRDLQACGEDKQNLHYSQSCEARYRVESDGEQACDEGLIEGLALRHCQNHRDDEWALD